MKIDVIRKAILAGEDEEAINKLCEEMRAERTNVMIQQGSEVPYILNLTADQIRLLDWLIDHGYMYEDFDYQLMDKIKMEEV